MDEVNKRWEEHVNSLSLKQLHELVTEQYAEIGYYFDVLSRERFVLQRIKDVIHRRELEDITRREE